MPLLPQTALSLLPVPARIPALKTAIAQLDEYILLGGLQSGTVVGLSCEDEDLGLLISLQTVSHHLVSSPNSNSNVMIVTCTRPIQTLLPLLRKAIINSLIALSKQEEDELVSGVVDLQAKVKECLRRIKISRVFDVKGLEEVLCEVEENENEKVDVVVVSDMPLLLGTVFGDRSGGGGGGNSRNINWEEEGRGVHEMVGELGGRLRRLAGGDESTDKGKRLVMLLNSVSVKEGGDAAGLRSVFSGGGVPGSKNKRPAYGQVFGRLVDLHLMGSRVPAGEMEAERQRKEVWVWVMEVLFDEVGMYDFERMERRDREGRWGVLEVDRDGGSVR
ncbi:hypothetical protein QBC44DRAFT_367140 [Cladorrhinum sp. PSN332]|nr:hypothetical protein QBC44DRAFT_367140 [Cladorrhinum sp. PSN332]